MKRNSFSLLLAMRIMAVIVAVLTLAFIALGLTANLDIFLVPDIVLAAVLIAGAVIRSQRLSALVMLIGFTYTAGVFSISVMIAVARGPMTFSTVIGLLVTVICVGLLSYEVMRSSSE